MEKIFSAIPFFYGATAESPNTVRLEIRMKDLVESETLARAVKTTLRRYPYFLTKVVVSENAIYLDKNDRSFEVREGTLPPVLGAEEVNYHLLSVAYEEKLILVDFFHGLADGGGILPFVRTLLYYYCCGRYGKELNAEGIRLAGSAIPEEEIREPYPQCLDGVYKPFGRYQSKPAFQLREGGLVSSRKPMACQIRVSEDAFMSYTKANDGSPGTMAAVFMFHALRDLHPESELPFICGMAMNIRSVLHKEQSHHSLVSQLFLEDKPAMKHMETETVAACCRGMVMLQSQPENIMISVQHNMGFFKMMEGMPDIPSRQQYMGRIVRKSMNMDTFKVSYVGRANLGESEQYVEGMESLVDINGAGIMIEINALNGLFDFCFMQEFEEDIYVKMFVKKMEAAGIQCEMGELRPLGIPGFTLGGNYDK